MAAIRFLINIYRFHKSAMLLALILTLLIKTLELAQPLVLSHIINALSGVIDYEQRASILQQLLYFVLLSFCCSILIPCQRFVTSHLLQRYLKEQCLTWNRKILSKQFYHLRSFHATEIIEAFYRARTAMNTYSWQLITEHITNLMIIVLILIYIVIMEIYWILPFTAVSAVIIIYISQRLTQKINPLLTRLYTSNDEYKSYFSDLYENSHNIQMTGLIANAMSPFINKIQKHHEHMTHISFWQIVLVSSNTFVIWTMQGVLLFLGSFVFKDYLHISTGDILGAYFYSSICIDKIKNLSNIFLHSAQWESSVKTLHTILNAKILENKIYQKKTPQNLDINLYPFSLKHENYTLSLKEKVHIPYGSKVGIVGASGSGKTLLLDIISGCFLTRGTVYISNIDVVELSLSSRAEIFSFAESEMNMLSGSLQSSILYSLSYPKNATLLLENLNLENYIHYLNKDYFPKEGLSTGERKRFEIFRSFSYLCPIVILDAPLESIQKHLASKIWPWILETTQACTLICTDHEDHYFHNFDYIIKIDQGNISLEKHHITP